MADKKNLPNPFPGLRPFQSDEEHLFFGRETQTLELLQLLRDNRFVGVIGTSGSGKSSLVRCGLLSELYGGSFLQAGTDWEVAVMNPGGGPFNQLSKSLVDSDIYDSEEADVHLKLNATLRRSRLGLVEAIRQAALPEGTNFLLVVDQFEEIFRYSEAGEEEEEAADDFISMILEASKQSGVPIYVIITMRSDYIGDCSKFEGLPEEINESEYLIPRLSREEYKSVIEGPVRVGGAKLAPRLLQRLLNDIGTESDQLPCLQHALMRTWEAWAKRESADALDLEDYRAIGGMSKALSIHADEIFDSLDDNAHRETATRMFRALTEKGDDNRGIRRPLRLQQLANITNDSIDEVKIVVEPYRQQGVTFLMPPSDRELEADTVIDISHESLMRVWQRLRNWVEEEAQSARVYRRLVDTSSLWKKEEAGLYHDPDLQIAQSWRDKYQPNEDWAHLYGGGFEVATEFLEASEEEGRKAEREKELARQRELEQAQELAEARERSARNMKRFAAVVGVVAVIALGAMVFAVKQQKVAEAAQETAIVAKGVAEEAKQAVSMEFARSDNSLGHSFANANPSRAIAHFARSLEVEPNNPGAIDRIFNLLAYEKPPKFQFPQQNLNSKLVYTTTSTSDGTLIATTVRGSNKNVSLWTPYAKTPKFIIPFTNQPGIWHQSLDINSDGTLLAVGHNHGRDSRIYKIGQNTSDPIEIVHYINRRGIDSIRFSNNGSKILTGSWNDKITEIYDTNTGESLQKIDSNCWYPIWSPDEKRILLANHKTNIAAVIEIETKETKLFEHENGVWHLASFDPSGKRILTAIKEETHAKFNVWDINSGKLQFTLKHDEKGIPDNIPRYAFENAGGIYATGAFTPNGQRIITTSTDYTIRLWDAKDGKEIDSTKIVQLSIRDQNPIFSDDGLRVMIPLRNGTCYCGTFNNKYSELPDFGDPIPFSEGYAFIANSGHLRPLLLPASNIISASTTSDGNSLFVGTEKGTAKLINLITGEQSGPDLQHAGELHAVAINDKGTKFATASNLGTIKVWNKSNLEKPEIIIGEDNYDNLIDRTKLRFSSDDKSLWVQTAVGPSLWDLTNGNQITTRNFTLDGPMTVSSPDNTLMAATRNYWVRVYKPNGTSFAWNTGNPIQSVTFSKDNALIAVGSVNGVIRVWEVETKKEIEMNLNLGVSVTSLNFNSTNSLLAAGSASGRIYLYKIPTGESADHLIIKGNGTCNQVIFGPQDRMLATVFTDINSAYAQVWNVSTGHPITNRLSNGTQISMISFIQNGGSVVVWPEQFNNQTSNGLASVWGVTISNGEKAPPHFANLSSILGGIKLDKNSMPIRHNDHLDVEKLSKLVGNETRSDKYLKWQMGYPGTRTDSPFRPPSSENYINQLISTSSLTLLEEAVRLRPRNPIALAKRGLLRLAFNNTEDGVKTLAQADIAKAQTLAPDNPFIIWHTAIAYESLGSIDIANNYYAQAKQMRSLNLSELESLINIQETLNTGESQRVELINQAINLAKKSKDTNLENSLLCRQFLLACRVKNFNSSSKLWSIIKEWDSIPYGINPEFLLSSYIDSAEMESERLIKLNKFTEASAILRPAAIAATSSNQDNLPSIVSKLVEFETKDTPPITLIKSNAIWKYSDTGTDLGTDWKEPWFPAIDWQQGPAKLGYGGDGETTELNFGPNKQNKYRTYYFRHTFEITPETNKPFLALDLIRDDGAVIYLNGKEIVRDNMPEGKIQYSTYASSTANENLRDELKSRQFTIDAELLEIGSNVITAEVHQSNNGSSDLGFQLKLSGSDQIPWSILDSLLNGESGKSLLAEAIQIFPKFSREKKQKTINKLVIINRFLIAANSGNHQQSKKYWDLINAWESLPEGIDASLIMNKYIYTLHSDANRLAEKSEFTEAINLLKPAAIATLIDDNGTLSKSVEKIFEWQYQDKKSKSIIPNNVEWKYLDDGSDQGAQWIEPDFNDQSWSVGTGKFGYGNDGEITILNYGGNSNSKHTTYYFRHSFEFNEDNSPTILLGELIRDDGAIIYLNGKEIIRSNMPEGPITFESYALSIAGAMGGDESKIRTYTIDPKYLIKGTNIIATEVHQFEPDSSDLGFSFELKSVEQTIQNYIKDLLASDNSESLIEQALKYIPATNQTDAAKAFNFALAKSNVETNQEIEPKTLAITLRLLSKIGKWDIANEISKLKVTNSNDQSNSEIITNSKELLRELELNMISADASEIALSSVRSLIVKSPPRNIDLPKKLIDLSDHYNASIYHHSGWHGGHENFDLRFLPDAYNQEENIPFDIRGIIQLESGEFAWDNGKIDTANSTGFVKGLRQVYPNKVSNIKIGAKTKTLHFLMSAIFGREESGAAVAKFVIHYEDGTYEELPIIFGEDMLDWFHANVAIESINAEKIGWIGNNNLGNPRVLTKPFWSNPHPEKLITHIDFISELKAAAPFLIAITAE